MITVRVTIKNGACDKLHALHRQYGDPGETFEEFLGAYLAFLAMLPDSQISTSMFRGMNPPSSGDKVSDAPQRP